MVRKERTGRILCSKNNTKHNFNIAVQYFLHLLQSIEGILQNLNFLVFFMFEIWICILTVCSFYFVFKKVSCKVSLNVKEKDEKKLICSTNIVSHFQGLICSIISSSFVFFLLIFTCKRVIWTVLAIRGTTYCRPQETEKTLFAAQGYTHKSKIWLNLWRNME